MKYEWEEEYVVGNLTVWEDSVSIQGVLMPMLDLEDKVFCIQIVRKKEVNNILLEVNISWNGEEGLVVENWEMEQQILYIL